MSLTNITKCRYFKNNLKKISTKTQNTYVFYMKKPTDKNIYQLEHMLILKKWV